MVLSGGAFRHINRYRYRLEIDQLLGHVVVANGDGLPFLSVLFNPYEAHANHYGISHSSLDELGWPVAALWAFWAV